MIKFSDRMKSWVYRALRSDAPNSHNACDECKKYKRNWSDTSPKKNQMVAFDRVLHEWVVFAETNFYAKTWIMNGYIANFHNLTDDMWLNIRLKCRNCIANYFEEHKDPEEDENKHESVSG